ncbi:hypothetical protein KKE78_02500 [Patescibacteria group bacterium]|nr:hypothetical protein [Patescibacteria group bacterium]
MDNFITDEIKQEFKPESRWFRKIWRKTIPTKLRKPIFVGIFILSLIISILTIIGIWQGVVNFNLSLLNKSVSNQSGIQQSGNNNSIVLSANTQCLSRYCSDFKKDDDWVGKNKFVPIQEDPLILKSPNSEALPGATMFYKKDVGNFTAKAFISPQATSSANLVLSYGSFYRCILGDADYELITCQINQSYPKVPEDWGYFDKDGGLHGRNKQYQKRPFQSQNELEIRFEQRTDANNTIISIKLNEQVPAEWILPKKFQGLTRSEKIGIGLITNAYDDAQAIFKHFELNSQL